MNSVYYQTLRPPIGRPFAFLPPQLESYRNHQEAKYRVVLERVGCGARGAGSARIGLLPSDRDLGDAIVMCVRPYKRPGDAHKSTHPYLMTSMIG
jgi:hypothetical protein